MSHRSHQIASTQGSNCFNEENRKMNVQDEGKRRKGRNYIYVPGKGSIAASRTAGHSSEKKRPSAKGAPRFSSLCRSATGKAAKDPFYIPSPGHVLPYAGCKTSKRRLLVLNISWYMLHWSHGLCDRVSTINSEISPRRIATRATKQVDHGAHQVFRVSHLTLRDQRDPLAAKLGVVIENLLGPIML